MMEMNSFKQMGTWDPGKTEDKQQLHPKRQGMCDYGNEQQGQGSNHHDFTWRDLDE